MFVSQGIDLAPKHGQRGRGGEPMGCDIVYALNFRQICQLCFNFGFD